MAPQLQSSFVGVLSNVSRNYIDELPNRVQDVVDAATRRVVAYPELVWRKLMDSNVSEAEKKVWIFFNDKLEHMMAQPATVGYTCAEICAKFPEVHGIPQFFEEQSAEMHAFTAANDRMYGILSTAPVPDFVHINTVTRDRTAMRWVPTRVYIAKRGLPLFKRGTWMFQFFAELDAYFELYWRPRPWFAMAPLGPTLSPLARFLVESLNPVNYGSERREILYQRGMEAMVSLQPAPLGDDEIDIVIRAFNMGAPGLQTRAPRFRELAERGYFYQDTSRVRFAPEVNNFLTSVAFKLLDVDFTMRVIGHGPRPSFFLVRDVRHGGYVFNFETLMFLLCTFDYCRQVIAVIHGTDQIGALINQGFSLCLVRPEGDISHDPTLVPMPPGLRPSGNPDATSPNHAFQFGGLRYALKTNASLALSADKLDVVCFVTYTTDDFTFHLLRGIAETVCQEDGFVVNVLQCTHDFTPRGEDFIRNHVNPHSLSRVAPTIIDTYSLPSVVACMRIFQRCDIFRFHWLRQDDMPALLIAAEEIIRSTHGMLENTENLTHLFKKISMTPFMPRMSVRSIKNVVNELIKTRTDVYGVSDVHPMVDRFKAVAESEPLGFNGPGEVESLVYFALMVGFTDFFEFATRLKCESTERSMTSYMMNVMRRRYHRQEFIEELHDGVCIEFIKAGVCVEHDAGVGLGNDFWWYAPYHARKMGMQRYLDVFRELGFPTEFKQRAT